MNKFFKIIAVLCVLLMATSCDHMAFIDIECKIKNNTDVVTASYIPLVEYNIGEGAFFAVTQPNDEYEFTAGFSRMYDGVEPNMDCAYVVKEMRLCNLDAQTSYIFPLKSFDLRKIHSLEIPGMSERDKVALDHIKISSHGVATCLEVTYTDELLDIMTPDSSLGELFPEEK